MRYSGAFVLLVLLSGVSFYATLTAPRGFTGLWCATLWIVSSSVASVLLMRLIISLVAASLLSARRFSARSAKRSPVSCGPVGGCGTR